MFNLFGSRRQTVSNKKFLLDAFIWLHFIWVFLKNFFRNLADFYITLNGEWLEAVNRSSLLHF